MTKAILVTGATGNQGGAVLRALLASGQASEILILAVTRNPDSPSAKKLAEKKGVKVVQGDLTDVPALFENAKKAADGEIWGVFSVQSYALVGKGSDPKVEVAQGKAMIDTAIANDVEFFVYGSVDRGGDKSKETPTPIAHFATKHTVEQHLFKVTEGKSMKWAVLRPVTFMDNLTPDTTGKGWATMWKLVVKKQPMHLVAVNDIGRFAAEAFTNPDEWAGKCITIAGDSLTFADADKIFKDKTGKIIPTIPGLVARGMMIAINELGVMFRWFNDVGYDCDVPILRTTHPGLLTWGEWLDQSPKWETK